MLLTELEIFFQMRMEYAMSSKPSFVFQNLMVSPVFNRKENLYHDQKKVRLLTQAF